MNNIQVLDCTLRDGGYCNEWKFGYDNTQKIIKCLVDANVEIIECGFLTNKVTYDKNITRFTTVEQISAVLPKEKGNKLFVAMVNYGEYNVEDLPECDGSSIGGLRVAFHKKELVNALKFCKEIAEKGYKVFIQPMVSLGYSDEEFLSLIYESNKINPYAFYIVDSFGMMKQKDLIRLFYLVEHNLNEDIWIGFHSHNNMQLAYSNAQSLVEAVTNRNLILDSSISGMGRGAGNLNTELFVEFLNEKIKKDYHLSPLLSVIDQILNTFYKENYWGYSLPNYLSAHHNAHPNYASYLDSKNTLTVEAMHDIFMMLDTDKKYEFDKGYIEIIYTEYMAHGVANSERVQELNSTLKGKTALLIAPGKSSQLEKDKIIEFSKMSDVITMGVNFDYSNLDLDILFVSNMRRFRELESVVKAEKLIVTSNIPTNNAYYKAKYSDLLTSVESVKDNAGLMAIKFLINMGIGKIVLAGFDGYSSNYEDNYASHDLAIITKNALLQSLNSGLSSAIKQLQNEVSIEFLTEQKHIKL